jgi:RNA polymerase sigma-70 factor (ECF subfamily)
MIQPTDTLVIDPRPERRNQAFHTLVEEHKRTLYFLALDLTGNHHDAEDLTQEVFGPPVDGHYL